MTYNLFRREMVVGKLNPLMSSFELSHYTHLDLMRRLKGCVQDMEYVIKNSFQQFQLESSVPEVRSAACQLG